MSHITEATAAEQAALGARALAAVEALEMDLVARIEACEANRHNADGPIARDEWRAKEGAFRTALLVLRKAMRGEA